MKNNMQSTVTSEGKVAKRIAIGILIVIFICFVAGLLYSADYYHAGAYAQSCLNDDEINILNYRGMLVFEPKENKSNAGFVFYPGGKVEYTAYAPLMDELARKGITCYLLKVPMNLAILDINAADRVFKIMDVDKLYIGGHSLGGYASAEYLSKHRDRFDGLVLLGAFAKCDLSDFGSEILSIYGSEDRILNIESYETNRNNLGKDCKEVIIDGGCHSYFGDYGLQEGDGSPFVDCFMQTEMTAEEIYSLIIK